MTCAPSKAGIASMINENECMHKDYESNDKLVAQVKLVILNHAKKVYIKETKKN